MFDFFQNKHFMWRTMVRWKMIGAELECPENKDYTWQQSQSADFVDFLAGYYSVGFSRINGLISFQMFSVVPIRMNLDISSIIFEKKFRKEDHQIMAVFSISVSSFIQNAQFVSNDYCKCVTYCRLFNQVI